MRYPLGFGIAIFGWLVLREVWPPLGYAVAIDGKGIFGLAVGGLLIIAPGVFVELSRRVFETYGISLRAGRTKLWRLSVMPVGAAMLSAARLHMGGVGAFR